MTPGYIMEIALLLWVVCGIAATFIAQSRGANGCLWFGLGVLLGPLGLALSFAAGSTTECPHCRSTIRGDASRCPKCQAELGAQPAEAPAQPTASATKKCPDCAEDIRVEARKCRFCGYTFPEAQAPEESAPRPEDPPAAPPAVEAPNFGAIEPPGDSRKTGFGARNLLIAIVAALILAGVFYSLDTKTPKPTTTQASSAVASTAEQPAPPSDDYGSIVAKFGRPDADDSTAYDVPRPVIPSRWITYRKEHVRFLFVPDAKVGQPPPYRWKLIGATDPRNRKPVPISEANVRLASRRP